MSGIRRISARNGSFLALALAASLSFTGCFADLQAAYVRADAAFYTKIAPVTKQKIADDLAAGRITQDQANDRNTAIDQKCKLISDSETSLAIPVDVAIIPVPQPVSATAH